VVEALLAGGASVHSAALGGETSLHLAAHSGHGEVVEALVAAGADISAGDQDGCTPLHWAAGAGQVEAMKALLAAGGRRPPRLQGQGRLGPCEAAEETFYGVWLCAVCGGRLVQGLGCMVACTSGGEGEP
jgi:ankyrin repeat protein